MNRRRAWGSAARAWRFTWLLAVGVVLIGCGSAAPARDTRAPASQAEPLLQGALTEFVPAAGLRWMVAGRPRQLAEHEGLLDALAPLVPAHRFEAQAAVTGIDLRHAGAALVAGFDYGTLYVVETTTENRRVEQLFAQRLTHEPITHAPHPRLRRLVGVAGDTPQALVSIRGSLAAFAVGDTSQARIVEAFARRQLRASPSSLRGAALSSLPSDVHEAPVRFYAPGPFSEEWSEAAGGLLAATTAIVVTASPRSGDRLAVRVVLAGDWSDAGAEASTRLERAWVHLARTPTGRLLGLHEPAVKPAASASEHAIQLHVTLALAPIVKGLRDAVSADVWEILDLERPSQPGEGTRPNPVTVE